MHCNSGVDGGGPPEAPTALVGPSGFRLGPFESARSQLIEQHQAQCWGKSAASTQKGVAAGEDGYTLETSYRRLVRLLA